MANLTKGAGELPVFFNLDQRVGEGCPNQPEDVALLSFLMRVVSVKTAISVNTTVTTACTPALIQNIMAFQRYGMGMTVDGRASPASPNGKLQNGKDYLIYALNVEVQRACFAQWPNLASITEVPAPHQVIGLVTRTLKGTGLLASRFNVLK